MLQCKICFLDYDTRGLKPVVGTCGHTICLTCSRQIADRCPFCSYLSFKTPAINFHVLEQMDNVKDRDAVAINARLKNMESKFDKMMSFMSECTMEFQRSHEHLKVKLHHNKLATIKEIDRIECKIQGNLDIINNTLKSTRNPVGSIEHRNKFSKKGVTLQCWACSSLLASDSKLSEDGVGVTCKCGNFNVITPKKEGFKWMESNCKNISIVRGESIVSEDHYHQFPIDTAPIKSMNCPVCDRTTAFWNFAAKEAKVVVNKDSNKKTKKTLICCLM